MLIRTPPGIGALNSSRSKYYFNEEGKIIMKRKLLRLNCLLFAAAVIVILTLGMTACSQKTSATATSTLVSIAIVPASPNAVMVGSHSPFTAIGSYSNGSTNNITLYVTWASDNTGVATIDSAGHATAIKDGIAHLTATQSGVTSPAVNLSVISLSSIVVNPSSPTALTVGSSLQFSATATYSDSSIADVSSLATWASNTPSIATINSSGLATAVAAGTAGITATLSGVTSPVLNLTVASH